MVVDLLTAKTMAIKETEARTFLLSVRTAQTPSISQEEFTAVWDEAHCRARPPSFSVPHYQHPQ